MQRRAKHSSEGSFSSDSRKSIGSKRTGDYNKTGAKGVRKGPRRSRKSAASSRSPDDGTQRLNKVLAAAGLGSRREVEALIVEGRVEIDREVVTNLAVRVDPRTATIKVDGVALKKPRLVYYALNKPTGVLSTNRDPSGRARVIDFVPDKERVFSVGRLDMSSEGLMLLTNDGDLAQRLAHPRFSVQKTYFVVVAGIMAREELERLHKGVYLAEGVARIDGATIRKQRKSCTELEIVLSEGKNREIRRILARAGHKVVTLRRIAIGPLRLADLPVGAARMLTTAEVRALYAATEHPQAKAKAKLRPQGSSSGSGGAAAKSGVVGESRRPAAGPKPGGRAKPLPMDDDFGFMSHGYDAEDQDDFEFGVSPEFEVDYDESDLDDVPGELIHPSVLAGQEWDDDFVSGGGSRTGSVISFDDEITPSSQWSDEEDDSQSPPPAGTRGRGARGGRGRSQSDARGTTGRGKAARPGRGATGKAATGGSPAARRSGGGTGSGGGGRSSRGAAGGARSAAASAKGRPGGKPARKTPGKGRRR